MADKKVTGTVKWFNVKKGCTCPPPLALVSAVVNADMSALTYPHAPSPANILAGLRAFYLASVRPPDSARPPTHENTYYPTHTVATATT